MNFLKCAVKTWNLSPLSVSRKTRKSSKKQLKAHLGLILRDTEFIERAGNAIYQKECLKWYYGMSKMYMIFRDEIIYGLIVLCRPQKDWNVF